MSEMPETITLKIDDRQVTVSPQTTILDAAAAAGIDIPHLCHDPAWNIPPSSSCRLCLVEVEGARAPVTSCSHQVSDGMVVRTDTEKIREMRRMVIELLLSDHPHDCLTCEQGGGCSLQEYAYALESLNRVIRPVQAPSSPDRSRTVRPSFTIAASAYSAGDASRFARTFTPAPPLSFAGGASIPR